MTSLCRQVVLRSLQVSEAASREGSSSLRLVIPMFLCPLPSLAEPGAFPDLREEKVPSSLCIMWPWSGLEEAPEVPTLVCRPLKVGPYKGLTLFHQGICLPPAAIYMAPGLGSNPALSSECMGAGREERPCSRSRYLQASRNGGGSSRDPKDVGSRDAQSSTWKGGCNCTQGAPTPPS